MCISTNHESQGFVYDCFRYAGMAMSHAALAVLSAFAAGKMGHTVYAIDTAPLRDCIP